ncbi:hypothetical protein [Devosia nitrariae]|uniref:Uncharacterized protein n=1 Tax=Devosia nitrariae TaxID=2071872 RepID=A0ABQ5VZ68_9HYPH|nr:hypothetical protein [Devosia nitrariae]GLQ52859.1 hypothetical protein GCM10010862_01170 [Devosia nitrariae]
MQERETMAIRRKNDPLAIFAAIAFAVSVLLVGYLVFFAGGDSGNIGNAEAPQVVVEPAGVNQ